MLSQETFPELEQQSRHSSKDKVAKGSQKESLPGKKNIVSLGRENYAEASEAKSADRPRLVALANARYIQQSIREIGDDAAKSFDHWKRKKDQPAASRGSVGGPGLDADRTPNESNVWFPVSVTHNTPDGSYPRVRG